VAQRQSVTVIGAGVIGLSTAFALWRDGHHVTLVERHDTPASGASRANGGQLSYRYVSPLASPSAPREALSWLGRPGSPVALHPNANPAQWVWLAQFLRACTPDRFRMGSQALLALALESQSELATWRSAGLGGFDWERPGKLILFRDPRSMQRNVANLADPQNQRVLSPDACLELEPAFAALRPGLAGGLFTKGEEVADCYAFCLKLIETMRQSERFRQVQGEASLSRQGTRCIMHIDNRALPSRLVVLAAGLGSRALARQIGLTLPLYPLQGYSLTLTPAPGHLPAVSVTDYDRRVVYARHGTRLRIAAMVDIGQAGPRADANRIAQLRHLAQEALPGAGPYEQAESWIGQRPATPDSVPIIERGPCENLLLNVGHGALGFTLAAGSARRIARLAAQTT